MLGRNLRVNAGELARGIVHVEVHRRSVGLNQLVATVVATHLAAHVALHLQLVHTDRQILDFLPYVPLVAVPRLEAGIVVAHFLQEGVAIAIDRTRRHVATINAVNGPAILVARVGLMVLLEGRIVDELGHVLAIPNVVLRLLQKCVHPLVECSQLFLQLLVGPVVSFQDFLHVELIAIVGEVVNLRSDFSILVVDHVFAADGVHLLLPLLPEVDVLHQSVVGIVDRLHDGRSLFHGSCGVLSSNQLVVLLGIGLGVELTLLRNELLVVGQLQVEIQLGGISTGTVIGECEGVEAAPVVGVTHHSGVLHADAYGAFRNAEHDLGVIESLLFIQTESRRIVGRVVGDAGLLVELCILTSTRSEVG